MTEPTIQSTYIFRLTAILICMCLIIFICAKLQMIIVPLIFSLIFSVMLYPIVNRLEAWHFSRGLAAFTSIIIASMFIGLMGFFLSSQLSSLTKQGPELSEKVDELIRETQSYIWWHYGIERDEQKEQLDYQVNKLLDNGGKIVATVISALARFITDVVLIPLFVFFLLYFRDFFMDFFHRAFKSTDNKFIDEILFKMHTIIQSWLVGIILVMIIVGILNTIGLLLLGIPYAAFFGFLAAFLLIFPFIGIILGSALPVIMALITKDSYWYAVGVVGIFWFIQLLEANIITPYIVGSKISINPLVAIVVLILFGNLWGISGLILALPITAICKIIFDTIPETKAFGFVLGEPLKRHLKTKAISSPVKVKSEKVEIEKDITA